MEVYVIRFCLIIQMARWACSEGDKNEIDLVSVERSVTLTEYFRQSAQQVHSEIAGVQLTQQQQQLLFELPASFQTAEALNIAEQLGMKERAFKDFLSRNIGHLFARGRHGLYHKLNV